MSSQIDIQLLSYKNAQRIRITLFAAEILEHIQMKHLWLFPIIFTKQITKKRLKEVILVYSRSICLAPISTILSGSILVNSYANTQKNPRLDLKLKY